MRPELADLVAVEAKMKKATAEHKIMVKSRGPGLMDLHGVGPVVAARTLADVGTSPGSLTATGSRPGPAPHHWAPRRVSRTGTVSLGLGTAG